jgi:hypothetical protein
MGTLDTGDLGICGISGRLDDTGFGAGGGGGGGVAACGLGGGAAAAAAAGFEAVGGTTAPAPTLILITAILAVIVAPSSTKSSAITPLIGAAISMAVLSVSILAMTSSTLTLSPTFFKNVMSPSLIESANVGDSTVTRSPFFRFKSVFKQKAN